MEIFSFSSVRTRLILLVFLVLVPIIILIGFNTLEQRRWAVERATAHAEIVFNFAVINEQKDRLETEEILSTLAMAQEVAKGEVECSSYLSSIMKNYPRYINFGVAQPDGEVVCSAVPFERRPNIADRSYFRSALENVSFSVGQYQVGRITGKPSINFGYPVLDRNRKVSGVIFTAVDLSHVTEFEFNATAHMPVNSIYERLDSNGSVLSSHPASQLFGRGDPQEKYFFEKISKEKKGTFTATGTDGVERMYLFSTVWGSFIGEETYVLLGMPVGALFDDSERYLSWNLAILAIVTVITILMMWFGGEKLIVRPVRVLVDVSKRLAAGDMTARAGLSSNQGELGYLSRAFDEMAGELEGKKEALRVSEERFRNAFKHAAIGMGLVTPDGHWLRVNHALCEMTGYSESELLTKTFQDITHPDDLEADLVHVQQLLAGEIQKYQMEKRYFHKDGHALWILLSVSLVRDAEGNPLHFISQIQNITERKRAEEYLQRGLRLETALRRIDEKILEGANFLEVLDIACDAIVEMGYRMCWVGLAEPDHTVRPIAARGFEEGYLEAIRVRWDESPEGRGPTGTAIRTGRLYVMQDLQRENLYAPWREAALKRGYHSSAAVPLKLGEDELIGCLNVYSERKDAFGPEEIRNLEMFGKQCTIALLDSRRLEELRDTSQRLLFFYDHVPLGYIAHDAEFRIIGWNPAAERIFGWSIEEVKGKHPFELIVPPEMQPHISTLWSKLREGGESPGDSAGPALRKDGTTINCEWFSTPLRDATGAMTGLLTLVHDVTEKTRLERQLQTAQRMEAVGTLAGGIAHDFNNALTGIVGFGELLRNRMAGDEQALHDLDEILGCADRASTLTRQLLAYARRQVMEPINLNLSTLVADLMRLIGKLIGEHIEVKTSLEKNVPTIHADRGQIEQVVMNLCLNARDAMSEGGRLTVETEDVYLEEEYVRNNPYMRTGRYALLTISDTGVGMDEKTRERVFDPFFTTKGLDKGTGLGLAMVYGIVKQHNGFIHLYSEPGKGTAFKVYFPAIEAHPDVVSTIRREEILRGGTETILLAEDEEAIRSLIERTLKELGYNVLVARNGEEAIEIFRRNKEIDLAVLDVVMPRKGGKDAFEEMHKANPNLKVIFMSGYTANAIHDSFVLIAGMPFLQKPFGPTVLARKIREVLDTQ
jgi:PAS domain S-box-containing protein